MDLSQEVRDAGHEVASATRQTLSGTLNSVLGRFLGWPFKTTSGYAVDRDGNKSETFATVIHTASEGVVATDPHAIPADAVAAVIDVCESMDLEGFRAAYRRIAQAKTLKKKYSPPLEGLSDYD